MKIFINVQYTRTKHRTKQTNRLYETIDLINRGKANYLLQSSIYIYVRIHSQCVDAMKECFKECQIKLAYMNGAKQMMGIQFWNDMSKECSNLACTERYEHFNSLIFPSLPHLNKIRECRTEWTKRRETKLKMTPRLSWINDNTNTSTWNSSYTTKACQFRVISLGYWWNNRRYIKAISYHSCLNQRVPQTINT